ncbi:EamA-like transporter family protein [Sphaerotilus hippei]|uniref:EamA-like transporter family protein n=1 Tax=Sphaerotilus hippei TaxID=744406 RepID=A0A318H8D2_9BURK|nr:DMT family transporter [Sphaerotilus hippei]PXW98132.1 EamA-like transporter family protein [Sphaerotilus hippei]
MTHRQAVATMLLVTLLWSIAGVVTRHLESAQTFEVTFWRSAVTALVLGGWMIARQGWRGLLGAIRAGGRTLWLSALCWSVMFTSFMVALTLTTVANVLITMSLAPLFTALIARVTLGHRLPLRTWLAIAVAGGGIAWMYGSQVGAGTGRDLIGTLVALSVPVAGATMWTLLQHNARQHPETRSDMTPAVLLGALVSTAVTLPLSLPFAASAHDIGLLGMLGVVQLAVPCLLAVAAGRVLKAPEASLLGLLEILFGVVLTWLGTSESPTVEVVGGGSLVLLALAGNEAWALWSGSTRAGASAVTSMKVS